MKADPNHLWIAIQPQGKQWYWCVKYPEGLLYEDGVMNTPEDALTCAVLALRLLSPKKK